MTSRPSLVDRVTAQDMGSVSVRLTRPDSNQAEEARRVGVTDLALNAKLFPHNLSQIPIHLFDQL